MCDKSSFGKLRDRVTRIEAETRAKDAAQDEQIKTLFGSVSELKTMSKYLMVSCLSIITLVMLISILALVWCAIGPNGYQAVTHTAKEFQSPINAN